MIGALKRRFRAKRGDSICLEPSNNVPAVVQSGNLGGGEASCSFPGNCTLPSPPPSFLSVQGGRIELVSQHEPTENNHIVTMEGRILELEESLKSLQERLQPEALRSQEQEKSIEEKLSSMRRVAKQQERIALQISKEQRALAAAQEARSMAQESLMLRLSQENKVLRFQTKQYEKCLDEVGRRVVAALLEQKSLREEVISLKSRAKDLEDKNVALSALLTPGGDKAAGNSTTQESPRDEGYSTMSSDIFCDFSKSFKIPGDLEDLIEEPENSLPLMSLRHSLPGYSSKTNRKPMRSKSDTQINLINYEFQLHQKTPRKVDFETWSVEDFGEGLEEDCSEMLWNEASFLNHSLTRRTSSVLSSAMNLTSNDTLFEHVNNEFKLSSGVISIPSLITSSTSSLDSELGAVGTDFTRDFYTLVRVGSSKSFNDDAPCDRAIVGSPEDVLCSDCTSSMSTEDGSLLQEMLSACGALGNHGKSGWVSMKPNTDAQTRANLLECGPSSSDTDSEVFEETA